MIVIDANHDIGGHAMVSGGKDPPGRRDEPSEQARHRRFRRPGLL